MINVEQKAYNFETMQHIERVRNLLNNVIIMLLKRGENHDQSKLESPEAEIFAKARPLSEISFGSAEYNDSLKEVKTALEHHYARNRHHPQHFENGVNDMTLIDLIEMLVDWKASSERHNDGNILKSITINSGKFNIGDQLTQILTNTAHEMDLL